METPNEFSWLERRLSQIENKLDVVRIEVAQLKTKAAFWGAAAGLVVAVVLERVIAGG
jgi:tetrahydromethanopterin S-methyltransferase subunit G